jgi:GWxTD domain-containing protein
MKKLITICLSIACLVGSSANAKSLNARFSYSTFYVPGEQSFVETYLFIDGRSVSYVPTKSGLYQGAIEVTIVYKLNNDIKYFDKYNLLSPESKDTITDLFNFIDQKRVSLPNGTYKAEVTIKDKNVQNSKPFELIQEVTLGYDANTVSISDVEFLSSYKPATVESTQSKNGYDLMPLVDNFFSEQDSLLKFYAEIYNTDKVLNNEQYLLTYYIETYEKKRLMTDFKQISKKASKPVGILLAEFNIANLPTGNYNLVIQVNNRNNDLLAVKEFFFQRSLPSDYNQMNVTDYRLLDVKNTFVAQYTDRDSMMEYIRCLWPKCSPTENNFAINQLAMADVQLMQQFFFDFWMRRDKTNPEQAWLTYKKDVNYVNYKFSAGSKKGYLTERGRVLLQYGRPNQVSESYNEPNVYPYEIWQYYRLTENQSNRKFVFYCPEIALNDFRLLHSDARGEIADPQWQLTLKRRTQTNPDYDVTKSKSNYGNQYDQLFSNPR